MDEEGPNKAQVGSAEAGKLLGEREGPKEKEDTKSSLEGNKKNKGEVVVTATGVVDTEHGDEEEKEAASPRATGTLTCASVSVCQEQ